MDTNYTAGRIMLTMLGAVAEFERALMLEHPVGGHREGKVVGKCRGRVPTAQLQAQDVARLTGEGVGASEIAKRLGIGRASVYRILGTPAA